MYCSNCGAKLEEGSKYCNNCGARITDQMPEADVQKNVEKSVWNKTEYTADTTHHNTVKPPILHKNTKRYLAIAIAAVVLVIGTVWITASIKDSQYTYEEDDTAELVGLEQTTNELEPENEQQNQEEDIQQMQEQAIQDGYFSEDGTTEIPEQTLYGEWNGESIEAPIVSKGDNWSSYQGWRITAQILDRYQVSICISADAEVGREYTLTELGGIVQGYAGFVEVQDQESITKSYFDGEFVFYYTTSTITLNIQGEKAANDSIFDSCNLKIIQIDPEKNNLFVKIDFTGIDGDENDMSFDGYVVAHVPDTIASSSSSGGGNVVDIVPDEGNSDYEQNDRLCYSCNGTGNCHSCSGQGKWYDSLNGDWHSCSSCHGSGICQRCHGTGTED